MTPRLWAFDVDGTLLGSDGILSAGVRAALEHLHARGDHVVLATGRSVAAAHEILGELPWVEWAVCANGAATLRRAAQPGAGRSHALVHHHGLPVAPLVQRIVAHDASARMAVEDLDGTCWINEHFEPGELMGPFTVADADHLGTLASFRMTVRPTRPGDTFGFEDHADLLARPDIGRRSWFDLVAPGVTKATGLERVRQSLGVDRSRTLAAGDESNDLEMLQWAAMGAAVGQRCPELGAVADRVVPSSDEDGLLVFLEQAGVRLP